MGVPSKQLSDLSVRKNIESLGDKVEELESLLTTEVADIMEMEPDLHAQYPRLIAVVSRLSSIVAPITPCKKGCDHCCKMAVTISAHEAQLIYEATGIQPYQPKELALDQAATVAKYMNVPCSFLKKGVCQIYEHRPLPCRTHYNVSSFPELCDTIKHPGCDVPNMDFRPIWNADMVMTVEAGCMVFSDLREFFPYGADEEQSL